MKKKTLTILLAAAMILSLTGCSSKKELISASTAAETTGDEAAASAENTETAAEANTQAAVETETEADTTIEETTTAETVAAAQGKIENLCGSFDDTTYTNEFFGLTFTIPDTYTMYTEEQILEENDGTTMEEFNSNYEEWVDLELMPLVMSAENENGDIGCLLYYCDDVSPDLICTFLIEGIEEGFTDMDMTLEDQQDYTETIAGHEAKIHSFSTEYLGMNIYCYTCMITQDNFFLFLNYSTVDEDLWSDIVAGFSPLNPL